MLSWFLRVFALLFLSRLAIAKGTVSTADMLPEALIVDMDPEMRDLDEDFSQYSTMTMKSASRETTREKFNWIERQLFPRLVTVGTAYTAGATTVILSAGHGANVRVGDVLRSMARGDAMWVTAVATDTLTVVPQIGSAVQAAGSVGDTLLIMSNAAAQGADFGQTAVLLPTLGYNYTQIFRHGYTFSRTATKVAKYSGREPATESAAKGVEHKRAIEYSGFWGARDLKTDPLTGEPVGFTGGLNEFIVSNRSDQSGGFTVDTVDAFLQTVLQHSSRNIAWYLAPVAASKISKFNRGGQGTAWRPDPQNVAGLKVDAFMSGVYGYEIPVVVKKDWNDFPTTLKQYGGWTFIVDHDRIAWRYLTDSQTKLLTGRASNGADRVSEEYLTEGGWEINNQANHGIIYGIT